MPSILPMRQLTDEQLTDEQLAELLRDSRGAIRDLDRIECRESLASFIKRGWHQIEPSTPYKHGWHMDAICEHLEAVSKGYINRLLINVPPGTSKSLSTSVFFPAWEWGPQGKPGMRYIGTSYSERYAKRDNGRTRNLVTSEWYQERWGDRVQLIKLGETKIENTRYGFREAIPFKSLTAGRADRLIIDDPHSTESAESDSERETTTRIFLESVPTRLNDPEKSAIIIIMQRLHEEDVSGVALANDLGYTHLCYDSETEILTAKGWVKFPDLERGVPVMGVNPATLEARWEVPTSYTDLPFNGELIHYKSMTADLAVTPDHRMIYGDVNDMRGGKVPFWRVRAAKDLPGNFYLPQVINWPSSPSTVSFGGAEWSAKAFAEFMGWYLSEGCASAKRCITRIVQKSDGPHVADLERVLASIPFKASRRTNGRNGMDVWSIGSKTLAAALEECGKSKTKRAPAELMSLGADDLRAFLMAYARGDGHFAKANSRKITIGTASRQMADDLQECAIKAGLAATLSRADSDGGRSFNGHTLPPSTQYRLYIRASKAAGAAGKVASKIRPENIRRMPYSGRVYCVSVPSTGLVVRRNGRVSVSGNCLPMEYDPSRHCVTYYPGGKVLFEDPRTTDGELLFPDRFPPKVVEAYKATMGKYAYAGQMQQMPVPRGGGIFQWDWWNLWGNPDDPNDPVFKRFPQCEYVVASLDTAFTEKTENDYSALTIWGVFRDPLPKIDRAEMGRIAQANSYRPKIILMHAWKKRLPLHGPDVEREDWESDYQYRQRAQKSWGLVEWVRDTCSRFRVDRLLIESKASGISVAQEIRRLNRDEMWGVQLVDPGNQDKVARAYSVQHLFSDGMVYAPDRDWADMVKTEMATFPKVTHDDITDTATQALKHLRTIGLAQHGNEIDADVHRALRQSPTPPKPLYPA